MAKKVMEGSPAPPGLLARVQEKNPDYTDGQKLLVKEGRLLLST